ncbi:MAG: hypothetical protein ACM3JD_18410 [Rudaea sp.]
MARRTIAVLILLAMVGLAGCGTASGIAGVDRGLEITNMTGALGGTPEQAVYSYQIWLRNGTDSAVQVQWIKPVPGSSIVPRLRPGELQSSVNQIVEPGGTIKVSGQLAFETRNLTKEEITRLEPFVTGFQVDAIRYIQLPGR